MIRAAPDGAQARAHETIVVGAGFADLTLATELARRGAPERVAAPVDARSPVTVAAGVAG